MTGRKQQREKRDAAHYIRERLGELLVRSGVISAMQLEDALDVQRREGGKLGAVLVRLGIASEDRIAATLAIQKGLEHVDLTAVPIDRAAATLIPERLARRRNVIPIALPEGRLELAMSDPLDIETIDDVALRTGYPVTPCVATPSQIRAAIDKYLSGEVFLEAEEDEPEPLQEEETVIADDAPVVRLVNQILKDAVREGASDIHLEPMERSMRVRYRIDGVLHEMMELPGNVRNGITNRVKVMSDMDIFERRRPQDGRMGVVAGGRRVDMRVASLPTPFGEGIIVRLLNAENGLRSLGDLGVTASDLRLIQEFVRKPYGAVLITGPTGSGKTTTLYSALQLINTIDRKLLTIEDPVEYELPGLTQIGVQQRIGLTFASGLRAALRADPDVIMVGEIRDPETAEITIRAALTGHLVLSSLHTNDAPSALTRLSDLGVPSYITSSAVIGVVAQRLARKLCEHCKQPADIGTDTLLLAGYTPEEAHRVKAYSAVGCERCSGTGYKGRVGLFEIMRMDEGICREILHSVSAERIRALAVEAGMRTLRRDALDKVAAGITSLEEIERVVV